MATQEAFTLDGLALNDGTVIAVLSADAPPPRQRQDWIGAADSEAQLLTRTPLHENRKVTLRCVVVPQASMDLAHDKILLVVDKLQKASRYQDGIALTWTPASGTRTVTFDVLAGEITDIPIDWENGWLAYSPQFTVELTCKPYWRGAETLTSTASSSSPFVAMEIPSVTGDVPALGRLVVTDTASQSRRHVEWGLEGPLTYNSGTSLLVDSDSLVTSGFAGTQSTLTGAYDPNAAGSSTLIFTVPNGGTTAVCGTGDLSHVGVFRVKARVQVSSVSTQFRLTWKANDSAYTSNGLVTAVIANAWCEVDLGLITVPAAVVGTQRWTGQVEVVGEATSPGVGYLDYLTLVPASNGYGKARAAATAQSGVLTAFDSFPSTTAAAALSGRVAPAGGTWATSGDATDFVFADLPVGYETVTRSVTAGTAGRFGLLGTATPSDVMVSSQIYSTASPSSGATFDVAVVARYVDASNYAYATLRRVNVGSVTKTLEIHQVVAGVDTTLASSASSPSSGGAWFGIEFTAYASGTTKARLLSGGAPVYEISGASTALATAGALATGKSGIFDRMTGSIPGARYWTSFTVATPAAEPIALYSGRNMQVRYDDVLRQDTAGTFSGRPPSYRGSRFLLPVGTSRVLVKARRNDIEANVDTNVTDALQIQVGWTPRGIAVPR